MLTTCPTGRPLVAAVALFAVAACSDDPTPSDRLARQATTADLRLSEIRFRAADDAPAFVELVNAGTEPIVLDGVGLRHNDGRIFDVPQDLTLAAGARLLVSFDGLTGQAEGLLHAAIADFPGGDAGSLSLETSAGQADAVTWGRPELASVDLCRGGRCAPPAAGSVIARVPGDDRPFAATAWAVLDPFDATPGEPNPRPPVSAFAGLPGMIFTGAPRFSWYSVPGAVRYRLEVATDDTFANIVHEAEIEATPGVRLEQLTVRGPELSTGDYVWRVQAAGAAGDTAAFSAAMPFSIDPSRSLGSRAGAGTGRAVVPDRLPAGTAGDGTARSAPEPDAPVELLKVLDVPVLEHAKDTRMLTLEAPSEEPPRSWDTPDSAGYPYCARAGVAMLNAFYGGKLSQDRIGYEAFKNLREGPEYDLPVVGMADVRISGFALPLAIGTAGRYERNAHLRWSRSNPRIRFGRDREACDKYVSQEAMRQQVPESSIPCPPDIAFRWGIHALADIRREIDAGRPLLATTPSHLFLIVGYRMRDAEFSFFYQDAGGLTEVRADGEGLSANLDSYWAGLAPIKVGSDEPELSRGSDSDNDGVLDFDETSRFGTDPANVDSDGDGIHDKEEIRLSVWDPEHGYHRSLPPVGSTGSEQETVQLAANADLSGRDFDGDGLAMELDIDSDAGGCKDGREDENANGIRESGETSNFDSEDDDCGPAPLGGRVALTYDWLGSGCVGRLEIRTRFELEPWRDPDAPNIVTVYRARGISYDIRTDGCRDVPGDHLVYAFNDGFHESGRLPLTEQNLGFIAFWPTWPKFSMQLPLDVTDPGREPNRLVGTYTLPASGAVYPAETSVKFGAVEVGSDPNYCGDPGDPGHGRPWQLEFCTEPTPCADMLSAPLECLAEPERYYVLPFRAAFEWNRANEPGLEHDIGNIALEVEICEGCGDEFLD